MDVQVIVRPRGDSTAAGDKALADLIQNQKGHIAVLPLEATQSDVLNVFAGDIQRVTQGQSAVILAYGPSGSGKTYTMFGATAGWDRPMADGLIFAAGREFMRLGKGRNVELVSVFVAGDKIHDLALNPSAGNMSPALFNEKCFRDGHTKKKYFVVPPSTRHAFASEAALIAAINNARRNIVVESTKRNSAGSSRGHACFTLSYATSQASSKNDSGAKLVLFDLAGAEPAFSNSIESARKQGININQDLTALHNYVASISGTKEHIAPTGHRASSLNRVLSEALITSNNLRLLCTISLDPQQKHPAVTALSFARHFSKLSPQPYREPTVSVIDADTKAENKLFPQNEATASASTTGSLDDQHDRSHRVHEKILETRKQYEMEKLDRQYIFKRRHANADTKHHTEGPAKRQRMNSSISAFRSDDLSVQQLSDRSVSGLSSSPHTTMHIKYTQEMAQIQTKLRSLQSDTQRASEAKRPHVYREIKTCQADLARVEECLRVLSDQQKKRG